MLTLCCSIASQCGVLPMFSCMVVRMLLFCAVNGALLKSHLRVVEELMARYWQDSHVGSSMPQNFTSVAALPAIFIWSAAAAAAMSSALMLPCLLLP